jgi:protein gp37
MVNPDIGLPRVAFFFKQWGKKKFNPDPNDPTISAQHPQHAKGGCQLNGKVYRNMPRIEH